MSRLPITAMQNLHNRQNTGELQEIKPEDRVPAKPTREEQKALETIEKEESAEVAKEPKLPNGGTSFNEECFKKVGKQFQCKKCEFTTSHAVGTYGHAKKHEKEESAEVADDK